ncbi:metal-binding protein [Achromobacter sp. SD115]|uniref:Ada metal-binding domain-containing protein n=1 Tax=Achromobacter sp. SD115 TaxID=2782011 RepID=UPI001A95944F|nr:Ada metal-binding domain-containing protein [Achromobacter sp. SD115]MBO1016443.1 metal-binding protein [Achromobacter sp. SD115]
MRPDAAGEPFVSTLNKAYTLLGPDGKPHVSLVPGRFGGHRGGKLYGRLDCRAALQAIARGGYVKYRVFFSDEAVAIAAGYRPCAVCMPQAHAIWKSTRPARKAGGTKQEARS